LPLERANFWEYSQFSEKIAMLTTCCENFERKGDPWLTERERREMQAQLAPQRGGRRYAKPPLEHHDLMRIARQLTPEEELLKKQRENMLAIRQLVKAKPRDLKPLGPKALEGLNRIYHPCNEELDPFDRDFDADERRWREFLAAERAK
jgi:hypothetical protein